MDKKRFNDLLQSMEEMVAIEKGDMQPAGTHRHPLPAVKSLREATGLRQDEFAKALNVSPSLVQSWEQQRRFPSGPALKLLLILEQNPSLIQLLIAL